MKSSTKYNTLRFVVLLCSWTNAYTQERMLTENYNYTEDILDSHPVAVLRCPPINLKEMECSTFNSALESCACEAVVKPNADQIEQIYNKICGLVSGFSSRHVMQIGNKVKMMLGDFQSELNQICTTIPTFESCIEKNFPKNNSMIDTMVGKFINVNQIGPLMKIQCDIYSDPNHDMQCLSEVIPALMKCLEPFRMQQYNAPTNTSEKILEQYCPLVGDVLQCYEIVSWSCDAKYEELFQRAREALSPTCKDLSYNGSPSTSTEVLGICGIVHENRISQSLPANLRTSTGFNTQLIVSKVVKIICNSEIATKYLQCVQKYVPKSNHPMDLLLQELVDFRQLEHRDVISTILCDTDVQMGIFGSLKCIKEKASIMYKCASPERTDPWNITNIRQSVQKDGSTVRQIFCRPLHDLILCFTDNVLMRCNKNLGELGRDVYFWTMREDCFGARNGTFEKKVSEGKEPDGASTSVFSNNLLLLSLSLFLFIFL